MPDSAVFEVTRSLRMLLHSQLTQASPGAVVTLLPPGDTLPESLGVNLYLYRVIESPFFRNEPWHGDRQTPPAAQPALSLCLYYLLTPLGTRPPDEASDQGDDAHTMLGVAMRTLHENPILNDAHLLGFDADTVFPPFLLDSFEQIKISLVPTTVDELSKIWATVNRPYRLSVAYEVSLVQIAPTPPPPAGGGIVVRTGLTVVTIAAPRLTALSPVRGALSRIAAGVVVPNDLRIDGFGFSFPGQTPIVTVGGQRAQLLTTPAPTDTSITVALPTTLDAGPQADVKVSLNRRTSAPLSFTVSPWIDSVLPVRSAIEGPTPPLTLSGAGFTATPQAVRFDLESEPGIASPPPASTITVGTFSPGGTDTAASITLPTTLVNGTWAVRLVLPDGSASNARQLEIIPRLDPTIAVTTTTVDLQSVHRLTLTGARLNGNDIRVRVDGVLHQAPPNTNPGTLVFTAGRLLTVGPHTVSVMIDGHESHLVIAEVI